MEGETSRNIAIPKGRSQLCSTELRKGNEYHFKKKYGLSGSGSVQSSSMPVPCTLQADARTKSKAESF
jgi:hypothetical protein